MNNIIVDAIIDLHKYFLNVRDNVVWPYKFMPQIKNINVHKSIVYYCHLMMHSRIHIMFVFVSRIHIDVSCNIYVHINFVVSMTYMCPKFLTISRIFVSISCRIGVP